MASHGSKYKRIKVIKTWEIYIVFDRRWENRAQTHDYWSGRCHDFLGSYWEKDEWKVSAFPFCRFLKLRYFQVVPVRRFEQRWGNVCRDCHGNYSAPPGVLLHASRPSVLIISPTGKCWGIPLIAKDDGSSSSDIDDLDMCIAGVTNQSPLILNTK